MGPGRGPFSLLKKPLFVKNKEEAKANNMVRQSLFCQQSLTCYVECYQCWGGTRCRWERRAGRQTLLLLWGGNSLIDMYQPPAKDLLAALHIKEKRPLAAAHPCSDQEAAYSVHTHGDGVCMHKQQKYIITSAHVNVRVNLCVMEENGAEMPHRLLLMIYCWPSHLPPFVLDNPSKETPAGLEPATHLRHAAVSGQQTGIDAAGQTQTCTTPMWAGTQTEWQPSTLCLIQNRIIN